MAPGPARRRRPQKRCHTARSHRPHSTSAAAGSTRRTASRCSLQAAGSCSHATTLQSTSVRSARSPHGSSRASRSLQLAGHECCPAGPAAVPTISCTSTSVRPWARSRDCSVARGSQAASHRRPASCSCGGSSSSSGGCASRAPSSPHRKRRRSRGMACTARRVTVMWNVSLQSLLLVTTCAVVAFYGVLLAQLISSYAVTV
ncbi:Protein timeless [Frankliniella fusca]|uniref:Protein timeless n=1 Tax=Frankliniella fusca TaxID=407009 RepID=A0AAE1HKI1_9NEOP|nr:Protein timeless [Frankliniella fusca]